MKRIREWIIYSGVWTMPISWIGLYYGFKLINPDFQINKESVAMIFTISCLIAMYVWLNNDEYKRNGKKKIGLLDGFNVGPTPYYSGGMKRKAMYPDVNSKSLFDEPTGVVLGKYKGKYVCKANDVDGHVMIIGGSGSGKSSAIIIPTLLSNPDTVIFALDIKGELSYKSCLLGDEKRLIFNPTDRSQWGYDPFYLLNEKSSQQDVLETMQTIAYSLISLPADIKDPFWKQSARNMLTGLLIYHYNCGMHTLVDVMDAILSEPVKDVIEKVCEGPNQGTIAYRYLVQFKGLEDQTLSGIFTELANHIQIFANDQNIRYAFKENMNKVNPLMLEEGYSVFLSIQEEKLTAYYDVLQLIINETLGQLEKRHENAHKILFIIDELPRILSAGKIERLLDGARTLRSRQVCLVTVAQSTEGLMSAYTENEIYDLVSNCPYIAVLNASSLKTQKMVAEWCGKYKAKKKSWDGSGMHRKTSVSYEEKDIVEPEDLMTLAQSGELIIITPYGYCRVKKASYYNDDYLAPIAEKIRKHNDSINEVIIKSKGDGK